MRLFPNRPNLPIARLVARLITLMVALLVTMTASAGVSAPFQQEAEAPAAAATPPDPLGRGTPRSTVSGLIGALAGQDYDRAALYFDLPAASNNRQRVSAAGQARAFQGMLDDGGSLKPFVALSNEPTGRFDDDLPIDQENVGEIKVQDKKIPVLLTRAQDGDQQVWRISRTTLDQIAAATRRTPAAQAEELEQAQARYIVAGAPVKDWGLLVGLGILVFGGLWMLSALLTAAMRRVVADAAANGVYRFVEAAIPPLSLAVAVGVFYSWADRLPVSIVARQTLLRYTSIITVVAVVWFGLRLVDAISELIIARMQRQERRQIVSIITLMRRAAKILLLVLSGIGILDTFGIDVTTGIAALGIGGIALALGAQKTVENLVGSVTVIADRPLQVGDFIRVGDVIGTVEDVGIRSTRLRTLERTVITIPNGDLSARQIDNFAARDRFLFNPTIAVDHRTPSAKLKEAIAIVQQVLAEHRDIVEGYRARLGSIGERSFNIDVFSYINTSDFSVQVVIREELLLTIYERLEAADIKLAFPIQTVVLAPDAQQEDSGSDTAAEPAGIVLHKASG